MVYYSTATNLKKDGWVQYHTMEVLKQRESSIYARRRQDYSVGGETTLASDQSHFCSRGTKQSL